MVMFDLPTKTKQERRAYAGFRRFLLDNGFSQIQFSVYAWYIPTGHLSVRLMKGIKHNLPPGGEVGLKDKLCVWGGLVPCVVVGGGVVEFVPDDSVAPSGEVSLGDV